MVYVLILYFRRRGVFQNGDVLIFLVYICCFPVAGSPARGRVSGSPALGRLSQATTPACSPVMKAVLERNARRSQGRMSMGYLLAPSTAPPLNVSGGALPGRLSGTPTPSPLLTDSTQTPTWSALFNTTASLFTPEGTAQTPGSVRRSKR